MIHKDLRTLLNEYDPIYPEEKISKDMMLEFMDEHEDCFERSQPEGHFTGSAWIVNYDNSVFLLTLHKKLGKWLQCGGHADGDSDIIRVAEREAFEESGLKSLELVSPEIFDVGIFDIDAHQIPDWNGTPAHWHLDVRFLLRQTDPNETIKISDESLDLKWFKEIPEGSGELTRMFEKWKNLS